MSMSKNLTLIVLGQEGFLYMAPNTTLLNHQTEFHPMFLLCPWDFLTHLYTFKKDTENLCKLLWFIFPEQNLNIPQ